MTVQQYRRQQPLPPTPPTSPPAKHTALTTPPSTSSGTSRPRLSGSQQVFELPKGLRKKKGKRRKGGSPGADQGDDEEKRVNGPLSQPLPEDALQEKLSGRLTSRNVTADQSAPHHSLTPPCDLNVTDLCLETPPSASICKLIRSLMINDLLTAGRALGPCRDINILMPVFPVMPTGARCKGKSKTNCQSDNETWSGRCNSAPQGASSTACSGSRRAETVTQKDIYRAGLEKRKILALYDDSHVPRLGEAHGACPISKCGIKRCSMWDALVGGEMCDVSVIMHIQSSLLRGLALPPFTMSYKLHVHTDEVTGSTFVCAAELVRGILPRFFACLEKRMHSLYTLNHPFGRGSPLPPDAHDAVLATNVWKRWAGCPQALQGRRSNPNENKTRIWLLDGMAEVSLSAECEPDESTIAPPINSSKGKGRMH